MSVMGLHPLAFYLSHIIFGIIKSTAVMVICTALLSIRVQVFFKFFVYRKYSNRRHTSCKSPPLIQAHLMKPI